MQQPYLVQILFAKRFCCKGMNVTRRNVFRDYEFCVSTHVVPWESRALNEEAICTAVTMNEPCIPNTIFSYFCHDRFYVCL